ncbi:MAG: S41 family peptidase [Patescibacteria group bacterium]
MYENFKKFIAPGTALIIILLSFFLGTYVGKGTGAQNDIPVNADLEPLFKAWQIVEERYVDSDKLKSQDLVFGTVSGLLKSLNDPYSVFFPPEEHKEFQIEISGHFEGIGMEVGIRKNILTVVAPLKGTPAEKAGIKAGDKILRIGDTTATDLSLEEAVRLIRGAKGTQVKLTILRNGDDATKVISVTRDTINIPVIDTEKKASAASEQTPEKGQQVQNDVFVIRLYNFSESSAIKFRQALREFVESGKEKLILDLRNNPGGFLEASIDIASWFLPQGEIIAIEDFGGKEAQKLHRSKGYDLFNENLKMVVLTNKGSASASEIVAGALQDHGIAKLVGERTFGKGSVQELLQLTGDTSIKITTAKWLTPKGKSISEGGLTPDFEVAEATNEESEKGIDPIMKKALELLK